jgi:hypothetical protein
MVTDSGAAGFWSYAHEDDAADSGEILKLASRLRAEFSLLTGDDLVLFVDRDGILWGEEWKQRIDQALVSTTFFIPIITTRYFKREQCRRELLLFVAEARSLGVEELVLPILYSEVPELSSDSGDEAIALVARTQYVDWRELRLAGSGSPAYRAGVNGLAQRLVQIAAAVAERQMQHELQEAVGGAGTSEADLTELLEQVSANLPDWLSALEEDRINDAQHNATDHVHVTRAGKLLAAGATPGALFANEMRFAASDLKLAESALELSQIYSMKTIQLDPTVRSILRLAREQPDVLPLVEELWTAVDDAVAVVRQGEEREADVEHWTPSHVYAQRRAHQSRTMKKLGETWGARFKLVREANALLLDWHTELHALREAGPTPLT